MSDLRAKRKARNDAAEVELQKVFNDFSKQPEDQAIAGLSILGDKVTADLDEQFAEVKRSKFADRELGRMLRMLEKRKTQLDKMYETVALDDGLMAAANNLILQWNPAEN